MTRELIHLYGPLSIQSFGLAIVIGLIIFAWLVQRHPLRKKIISRETFYNTLLLSIFIGFAGGRFLYVITNWQEFTLLETIQIWQGGFSLLGGFISILLFVPLYLIKKNVPIIPFTDLVSIHAPLLQAISRIGCFLAGCCFGRATNLPWGIIYTDPESFAPCNVSIHPTQLYSALASFGIFLLLYFGIQRLKIKPGQLTALFLILSSLERFFVDFLRADREFFSPGANNILSIHQVIALGILGVGMIALVLTSLHGNYLCQKYEHLQFYKNTHSNS